MTARASRPGGMQQARLWPVEQRPAPASAVIHALRVALFSALCPKADGTHHHRRCLNRTVNASPTDCSDACRYAVGAYLLSDDWIGENF